PIPSARIPRYPRWPSLRDGFMNLALSSLWVRTCPVSVSITTFSSSRKLSFSNHFLQNIPDSVWSKYLLIARELQSVFYRYGKGDLCTGLVSAEGIEYPDYPTLVVKQGAATIAHASGVDCQLITVSKGAVHIHAFRR